MAQCAIKVRVNAAMRVAFHLSNESMASLAHVAFYM